MKIVENFENKGSSGSSTYEDPEDAEIVSEAKKTALEILDFSYRERDVILYNLGIGATEQELQWTFEGHDQFSALPTFGVIPQFMASSGISLDFLPNYNPVRN
jgi:multifunctional beta-oxidation protein